MENLNINFEEILVKNLISNNRFLGITAGFLVDSAFANIANKEIYKIVKNYLPNYKTVRWDGVNITTHGYVKEVTTKMKKINCF